MDRSSRSREDRDSKQRWRGFWRKLSSRSRAERLRDRKLEVPLIRQDFSSTPPHERPAMHYDHTLSKWVIRASALGSCPTKLALIATGRTEEFSPAVLRAFAAGHEHEEIVKDRLRRRGYVIDREQDDISLDLGAAVIKGHWDGRIQGGPESESFSESVLEVKSMREESYMEWLAYGFDAFPTYAAQVSFYSYATGIQQIVFATQCKSDLSLHLEHFVEPPVPLGDLLFRVYRTLQIVAEIEETGSHPPCTEHTKQKFPCPFEDAHDLTPEPVVELEDDPDGAISHTAQAYLDLSRQIKDLEERQKSLRGALEDRLNATGCRKARCGKYSFQRIYTTSRDYGALLRDNPEIAKMLQSYERTNSYVRIDGPRKK